MSLEKIFNIINKKEVSFSKEHLLTYLMILQGQNIQLDTIQYNVKLLNTIVYYMYKESTILDIEIAEVWLKFNYELENRIALENSYEWVTIYNELLERSEPGNINSLKHSCLSTTCTNDILNRLYKDDKYFLQKIKNFKKELGLRRIDIRPDNDPEYVTTDKDFSKYLKVFYTYMGENTVSPLWRALIPSQIIQLRNFGIYMYTNTGFSYLNEICRTNMSHTEICGLEENKINEILSMFFLLLFPISLSEDIVVYRADKHNETSETIKTCGYDSCGFKSTRAKDYMKDHGRFLRITIPLGTKFIPISFLSGREDEIVIMPSTIMTRNKCKKIKSSDNYNKFCDYTITSTHEIDMEFKTLLFNQEVNRVLYTLQQKKTFITNLTRHIKDN